MSLQQDSCLIFLIDSNNCFTSISAANRFLNDKSDIFLA